MTEQQPLPAPVGPPRDTTPPFSAGPPPRPRRRRTGIVLAIVGGAMVFVVLIGLVAWGASSLAHRVVVAERHALPAPHATHAAPNTGPRTGAHHATAALDCADDCITMPTAAAGVTLTSAELTALGAPTTAVPDYDTGPGTPQQDYADTRSDWEGDSPSGDDCLFTYAYVPLGDSEHEAPGDDGSTTRYLEEYAATDDSADDRAVTIGARTFLGSAQASAYSRSLEDAIALCRHYAVDGWDADVDAVDAWPSLPSDITAVGWIEHDVSGGAFVGVDLQRGDLVVRTTIGLDADPGPARLEAVVSAIADRMERLPADGSSPPNA